MYSLTPTTFSEILQRKRDRDIEKDRKEDGEKGGGRNEIGLGRDGIRNQEQSKMYFMHV